MCSNLVKAVSVSEPSLVLENVISIGVSKIRKNKKILPFKYTLTCELKTERDTVICVF